MESAVGADSFFPMGKLAEIDASGYERNYTSHYYTMMTRLKLSSLLVDLGRRAVLDILVIEPPAPGWNRGFTVEEGILGA